MANNLLISLSTSSTVYGQISTLVDYISDLSSSLTSLVSLLSTRRMKRSTDCTKINDILSSYESAISTLSSIIAQLEAIGTTGISTIDDFVAEAKITFEAKLSTLTAQKLALEDYYTECGLSTIPLLTV